MALGEYEGDIDTTLTPLRAQHAETADKGKHRN
jgi:hypothetical protein